MPEEARRLQVLRALVRVLSVINVLLAVNFFPLVPFLGWLNFGRAGWATAWMPEVVMLVVLPAGYYLYWHFWLIVAGVPLLLSLYSWRQGGGREARAWSVVNALTIAMYLAARIILAVQGIRPDIV